MRDYHLPINERSCIYPFIKMGMRIRKMAKALNKNPSTISREIVIKVRVYFNPQKHKTNITKEEKNAIES